MKKIKTAKSPSIQISFQSENYKYFSSLVVRRFMATEQAYLR